MQKNKYYKKDYISKKYLNNLLERLSKLFESEGTIIFDKFSELAWILDIKYDDKFDKALDMLEKDGKTLTMYRRGSWWLDVIPF